ncbi:hypothetical protein RYX36_034789, partial [Vicia faba]
EYASVDVTVTVKHKRAQLAEGVGMTFAVGALKTIKCIFSPTPTPTYTINKQEMDYYL